MENKIEQKQNKPELENFRDVSLHAPNKTIEVVQELKEALASRDEEITRKILEDFKNRESLIVRKGESGENFNVLKDAMMFLVEKEFGSRNEFMETKTENIIKWIHETNLPENILSDMIAVFSHQKDELNLFRFLRIIEENAHLLKDKNIILEAEHHLASWEISVYDNKYAAARLNKEVLASSNDPFITNRARFGLSLSKDVKPKDKALEFEKISAIMREIGDKHNSIRALATAAEGYLALAKREKEIKSRESGNLAEENFEKAKALADEAFKRAKEIDYHNAKIQAMKVLIDLFEVLR